MQDDRDLHSLKRANRLLIFLLIGQSIALLALLGFLVGMPLFSAYLESLRTRDSLIRGLSAGRSSPWSDSAEAVLVSDGVVWVGSLSLVVSDPLSTQQQIEALVNELADEGALIVSSEMGEDSVSGVLTVWITLRVPAQRFEEVMSRLSQMALQVTWREIGIEEVKDETLSLNLRLESLQVARQRLLEILKQARTFQEVLEVEQQIAQREQEIASLKGRLDYLAHSVPMAEITVRLSEEELSAASAWQPATTFSRAGELLLSSLRAVVDFLMIVLIAILPWAGIAGLLLWGAWRTCGRRWLARFRSPNRLS